MEKPQVLERSTDYGSDDELGHMVAHCNENITLCGIDASTMRWGQGSFEDDPDRCIVCDDIDQQRFCRFCGHDWEA